MEQLMSALGLVVILGIAWALSTNRRHINWRVVIGGNLAARSRPRYIRGRVPDA